MTMAPTASRSRPICGRLEIARAKPDTAMAIASEAAVIVMSYDRGMGREKASMPMKCIDQMPHPMATAPPSTQIRADRSLDRPTREDRLRAV